MPQHIISISHTEAIKIVEAIVQKASTDGGHPIAVAVVDYAARLVAFTAMDKVMPASIKLAQSKAYSAVIGKKDTVNWASTKKHPELIDFDMRNWTDENFTGFTGGLVIEFNNQIIGAVGVSGRNGKMKEGDVLMQDTELAEYGKSFIKL